MRTNEIARGMTAAICLSQRPPDEEWQLVERLIRQAGAAATNAQ